MPAWEYATLDISAVQLSTQRFDPGASSSASAEWQVYAIGPDDQQLYRESHRYTVPWARIFASYLNRMGADDWELVSVSGPRNALFPTADPNSAGFYTSVVESRLVFKRPGRR